MSSISAIEAWKQWCAEWEQYPLPQIIYRSVSSRIRPSSFKYKIFWKKGNESLFVDFAYPPNKVMVDCVSYDIGFQPTHTIQTLDAEEALEMIEKFLKGM